jgi:hypothetical protein
MCAEPVGVRCVSFWGEGALLDVEEKRILVVEREVERRRWVGMWFQAGVELQDARDEGLCLRVLGDELSG